MKELRFDLRNVLEAKRLVAPFIRNVPMWRSANLSDLTNADVWLKLESLQPTGSFKIRGALNKIGRLSEVQRSRGLVTASADNHALGVAYAIGVMGGVNADIFVPSNAPTSKLDKLRRFPVELHLVDGGYHEAHKACLDFAQVTGALEVSAYNDMEVIYGQATMGLEILMERPETDLIIVPVGGGGMLAGISAVANISSPNCRIVGVQPEASPAALLSIRDGRAYDPYDHQPTIADGLAGGFGSIPLHIAGPLVSQILLCGEGDLRRAVFTLIKHEQLVVETSGAISIVPFLNNLLDVSGNSVACVISGGNVATGLLTKILEEDR